MIELRPKTPAEQNQPQKTTMKSGTTILSVTLVMLCSMMPERLAGHPGHEPDSGDAAHVHPSIMTSDWGRFLFRHAAAYKLPEDPELAGHLIKNHGGSVTDKKTGALYTTIGAKVIRFVPGEPLGKIMEDEEKFGTGNFHGLTLVEGGEKPSFYFADNERHLIRRHSYANGSSEDLRPKRDFHPYFEKGGSFNPTDVEIHPETGNPWVFDGYGSNLVFDALATDSSFGGKEIFRTSHGGSFYGGNWVVCSRGSGEICTVNQHGEVSERFSLPQGSLPCDIDFLGDYALIGCLRGPGAKTSNYPGAPCYIYHWPSKKRLATVVPKSDFAFEKGTHIHQAMWWPHMEDGKVTKLFIAFSFWNPGDFKLVEVNGLPLDWLPKVAQD